MEEEINETPPQTPPPAPPQGEESPAADAAQEIVPAPKKPIVPANISKSALEKLIEAVKKR